MMMDNADGRCWLCRELGVEEFIHKVSGPKAFCSKERAPRCYQRAAVDDLGPTVGRTVTVGPKTPKAL